MPSDTAPTDRREFDRTVVPHFDSLYGAAMRLTRDPQDAEDLVQDTMVRAFRFWSTFKPGTNIKAWLFTILRNTFITGYHRNGRKRAFESDVSAHVRSAGPAVAVAYSNSRPPGPEDAVSEQTTAARIREALACLPETYRASVVLADIEGRSYKEIAEITGVAMGTVMSRIYRGRELLHKLLFDHASELGLVGDVEPGERTTRFTRTLQVVA